MLNRRNRALCAALSVALPLMGGASAFAADDCPVPNPVRVCTEFFQSDYVLSGKVISMKQWPQPPQPDNIEGWFYQVQVERSFKGGAQMGRTIEFYNGNDPTGLPIKQGQSYLLFVKKNDEGRMAANHCGNTTEMAKAQDKLKALDQVQQSIATSADGNIGGEIFFAQPGTRTLSQRPAFGVVVIAKSTEGGSFRGLTDSNGNFNISVPPGTYNVEGQPLSKALEGIAMSTVIPYPLSAAKPTNVQIQSGSCIDMELLAEENYVVPATENTPPTAEPAKK